MYFPTQIFFKKKCLRTQRRANKKPPSEILALVARASLESPNVEFRREQHDPEELLRKLMTFLPNEMLSLQLKDSRCCAACNVWSAQNQEERIIMLHREFGGAVFAK